jgi:WD repeat-containing protein 19
MLDADNKITMYSPKDKAICSQFKPASQIQRMWPNYIGNKAVCIDKSGKGFLLNFVWESQAEIQGFSPQLNKVIWDSTDPNMFIGCSSDTAYTFIHNKNYYTGESCSAVYELLSLEDVDTTKDLSTTSFDGVEPVFINGGSVVCLTKSNSIQTAWLGSHSSYGTYSSNPSDPDTNLRYFFQNLMLCKFENALSASTIIPEDDKQAAFNTLAQVSLKNMNILVAKKAYQMAGNISMVYTLDSMLGIEEKKILQGFISMIFCDYQLAQESLLSSSKPELGLDLRCDTKEWSIALNLAENMAPERVPLIRRRCAEDQEKQGQFAQALKNYQASVIDESKLSTSQKEKYKQHNILCQAGIARTSIRTDNITRGYEIGQDLNDKELIGEIATSCEEAKAYEEAADLYERAEDFEKAASLYIATKNFKKAESLIDKLSSAKVLASLAKMKETEGKFKEAENAFLRAKDWENVLRLNLTKLNDYDKAVRIFKEKAPTQACANILADYCEGKGMKGDTIKFMVLAGKQNDAFAKAQVYQEMETYANSLEEMTEKEALKIAQYFEGVNKFKQAATYYEKAGKFTNSLDCFIQSGDENLDAAIECVARSQNDTLFFKMLDYLEGDDHNDPKDPKYAFKLYLTFGKIEEASKIAIAMVKSEMEEGKYKEAHKIVINMLTEILDRKAKISYDLIQKTIVIHSYTLVDFPT